MPSLLAGGCSFLVYESKPLKFEVSTNAGICIFGFNLKFWNPLPRTTQSFKLCASIDFDPPAPPPPPPGPADSAAPPPGSPPARRRPNLEHSRRGKRGETAQCVSLADPKTNQTLYLPLEWSSQNLNLMNSGSEDSKRFWLKHHPFTGNYGWKPDTIWWKPDAI